LIGLKGHGLEIVNREPIEVEAGESNKNYLNTKKNKMGHLLD
jgi:3,4-dihydroxy 2-butanone 4-phosphate synthase/GTP cyclohydrolase II